MKYFHVKMIDKVVQIQQKNETRHQYTVYNMKIAAVFADRLTFYLVEYFTNIFIQMITE